MHPALLNNSLFLRYYKQWQDDPESIVFASIADFFLTYGMVDEAFKICAIGLKKHPNLISGKLVMSKIHMKRGNWEEAEDELKSVLNVIPENRSALALIQEIASLKGKEELTSIAAPRKEPETEITHNVDPAWNTVTMASIYAAQGHFERAKAIYKAILHTDPANESAKRGMESLP